MVAGTENSYESIMRKRTWRLRMLRQRRLLENSDPMKIVYGSNLQIGNKILRTFFNLQGERWYKKQAGKS